MTAIALLTTYAVLGAAMVVIEAWARRHGGVTLAMLFIRAMRRPAGRWFVLLGWWWLGWHLFVRSG